MVITHTLAVVVAQSLLQSCMAAIPATRGVEPTLLVLRCTLDTKTLILTQDTHNSL